MPSYTSAFLDLLKREFESIRARPASDGKPLSRAGNAKMGRGA
jgi:hypothetical protein